MVTFESADADDGTASGRLARRRSAGGADRTASRVGRRRLLEVAGDAAVQFHAARQRLRPSAVVQRRQRLGAAPIDADFERRRLDVDAARHAARLGQRVATGLEITARHPSTFSGARAL